MRNQTGTALDRWPRCARCKQPVEAIEKVDEGSKSKEYRARCHGEWEHQVVSWEHWSDSERDAETLKKHISSLVFFKPDHWEND